ncbi:ArsC family reductase [Oceanospirillaceae bacterium ASx5O]|nr:ArsC family reductase [Oceanospirillaceae bacterium ASx5O]
MVTLYGIKNCDTIKKARAWLQATGIEYAFHDYKKDGLSAELLDSFLAELSWEDLLNKRGTTWRALPDDVKAGIDAASAKTLMLDNPSIIKRPLLDTGNRKVLGFSADDYAALFN